MNTPKKLGSAYWVADLAVRFNMYQSFEGWHPCRDSENHGRNLSKASTKNTSYLYSLFVLFPSWFSDYLQSYNQEETVAEPNLLKQAGAVLHSDLRPALNLWGSNEHTGVWTSRSPTRSRG